MWDAGYHRFALNYSSSIKTRALPKIRPILNFIFGCTVCWSLKYLWKQQMPMLWSKAEVHWKEESSTRLTNNKSMKNTERIRIKLKDYLSSPESIISVINARNRYKRIKIIKIKRFHHLRRLKMWWYKKIFIKIMQLWTSCWHLSSPWLFLGLKKPVWRISGTINLRKYLYSAILPTGLLLVLIFTRLSYLLSSTRLGKACNQTPRYSLNEWPPKWNMQDTQPRSNSCSLKQQYDPLRDL